MGSNFMKPEDRSFADLRACIDDQLLDLASDPADLHRLVDLLEQKKNEGMPPAPLRPHGLEVAALPRTLSSEPIASRLQALAAERDRLRGVLAASRYPLAVGAARERLERIAAEVQELRDRSRHTHPVDEAPTTGRAARRIAAADYERAVRRWQAECADILRMRHQIVARLRSQIERPALRSATRLPWTLLPPGTWSIPGLIARLESSTRRRVPCEDRERFERIARELKPAACHVGTGRHDFEGYVAFTFPGCSAALLDNPIVGNAVYLLMKDWPVLSRLTKRELLDFHHEDVERVVHLGDWMSRVKAVLHQPHLPVRPAA